jgi:hypothetical protein
MEVAEVEGFEGDGRGVMVLLQLWKCVEKWVEAVSSEQRVVSRKAKVKAMSPATRWDYGFCSSGGGGMEFVFA